jgi:hypothetical protein
MGTAMADVFLAYHHSDRQMARVIAEALEGYGFSVWWDINLLPGEQFRDVIAEVIRTSRAALVLWSTKSIKSDWVLDEAARAKDENKLVPLKIDDASIPFGFGAIHAHCLERWDCSPQALEIGPLLQSIEHLVGRPRLKYCRPKAVVDQIESGSISSSPPKLVDGNGSNILRRSHTFLLPLLNVSGLFTLISAFVFLIPVSPDFHYLFTQLTTLIHVYFGMIILGGGLFLFLFFRLAAKAPTREGRWACARAARELGLFIWLPAAIAQPFLGLLMLYVKNEFNVNFLRWIALSFVLYLAAFLLWVAGFRAAWEAANSDAYFVDQPTLQASQFKRNLLLGAALACTVAIYTLMVYRAGFQALFY